MLTPCARPFGESPKTWHKKFRWFFVFSCRTFLQGKFLIRVLNVTACIVCPDSDHVEPRGFKTPAAGPTFQGICCLFLAKSVDNQNSTTGRHVIVMVPKWKKRKLLITPWWIRWSARKANSRRRKNSGITWRAGPRFLDTTNFFAWFHKLGPLPINGCPGKE